MAGKRIDLTGRTFGALRVIEDAGSDGTAARWLCECSCGLPKCKHRITTRATRLLRGIKQHCGAAGYRHDGKAHAAAALKISKAHRRKRAKAAHTARFRRPPP